MTLRLEDSPTSPDARALQTEQINEQGAYAYVATYCFDDGKGFGFCEDYAPQTIDRGMN
jgi:hypothetical protein